MSLKNKLTDPNLSSQDEERILRAFAQKKTAEDLKARYAKKLAEEHGVVRQPITSTTTPPPAAPRQARIVTFPWRMLSIAASLLLLISLWYLFQPDPPQHYSQIVTEELDSKPFPGLVQRSVGIDSIDRVIPFINAYEKSDFARAVVRGEGLQERYGLASSYEYYLGLSYLYTRAYDKALPTLRHALRAMEAEGNSELEEECRWYYVIALLKFDRVAEARQELAKVEAQDWRGQRAIELRERLAATE